MSQQANKKQFIIWEGDGMSEKPTVNDGKGLFDTPGFIDTLIVDVNDLVGDAVGGRYVQFCAKAVEIVSKLSELKNGVAKERKALEDQIAELRRLLNDINAAEGGANV